MQESGSPERVFISHAYPEENGFTQWLTSRLRVAGYEPWADLGSLKGGEPIWPSVEEEIRQNAFRVLFVLSRSSNTKSGTLRELNLARKLGRQRNILDFVVPLAVDDLASTDYNIEIGDLTPICFSGGWAQGLAQLLEKLEAVGAPRVRGPDFAREAWRERTSGEAQFSEAPEALYTNAFAVTGTPSKVYSLERPKRSTVELVLKNAQVPMIEAGDRLYCFVPDGAAVHPALGHLESTVHQFMQRPPARESAEREAYNATLALLAETWHMALRERGLGEYVFANNSKCFFFPADLLDKDKISFSTPHHKTWRSVVGVRKSARWHFGVSAYFTQFAGDLVLFLRPRVVFSDNGTTPWESTDRQHSARRSMCRNWWNAKWRDLLMATTFHLADGADEISLAASAAEEVRISRLPIMPETPFSYQHSQVSLDQIERELAADVDDEVEPADRWVSEPAEDEDDASDANT